MEEWDRASNRVMYDLYHVLKRLSIFGNIYRRYRDKTLSSTCLSYRR